VAESVGLDSPLIRINHTTRWTRSLLFMHWNHENEIHTKLNWSPTWKEAFPYFHSFFFSYIFTRKKFSRGRGAYGG